MGSGSPLLRWKDRGRAVQKSALTFTICASKSGGRRDRRGDIRSSKKGRDRLVIGGCWRGNARPTIHRLFIANGTIIPIVIGPYGKTVDASPHLLSICSESTTLYLACIALFGEKDDCLPEKTCLAHYMLQSRRSRRSTSLLFSPRYPHATNWNDSSLL